MLTITESRVLSITASTCEYMVVLNKNFTLSVAKLQKNNPREINGTQVTFINNDNPNFKIS